MKQGKYVGKVITKTPPEAEKRVLDLYDLLVRCRTENQAKRFIQKHTNIDSIIMSGKQPLFLQFSLGNIISYLPNPEKILNVNVAGFRCHQANGRTMGITPEDLKILATKCPNLKHLDLNDCLLRDTSHHDANFLTPNHRPSIAHLSKLRNLEYLCLSNNDYLSAEHSGLSRVLQSNPNLSNLNLAGNNFSNLDLSTLSRYARSNIDKLTLPNYATTSFLLN